LVITVWKIADCGYNRDMTCVDDGLNWIDSQHDCMVRLVTDWCRINSFSRNLPGLATLAERLGRDFGCLNAKSQLVDLPGESHVDNAGALVLSPLGKLLHLRKRPEAQRQVLLSIHMDTVYSPEHPLQDVADLGDGRVNGPGVADAKGGLCVMLIALQALEQLGERLPEAANLGWEILINPDEELGSPGSAGLLREAAARNHLGLVFEPALEDGSMVGERKGSGNFDAVIRGKSAHAGRDFHTGRNAIAAAAELVLALEKLHEQFPGVTVNVGRIDGGGPTNIVPDLAIVRFNVRLPGGTDPERVMAGIQDAIDKTGRRDGIRMQLHGGFTSPPRPMDPVTALAYEALAECGRQLGLNLKWVSSGGVSDANKLSAGGLPVIDSLGPSGGNLHSPDEFMLTRTLVVKAKLTFLLLSRLAQGRAGGFGRVISR
jgi:glutamate carboxypeptidase